MSSGRILLVEDRESLRRMLERAKTRYQVEALASRLDELQQRE